MDFIDIHTHHENSTANVWSLLSLDINDIKDDICLNNNCSVGLHPWKIDSNWPSAIIKLDNLAKEKKIKAIGECGLDKTIELPLEDQMIILEEQLKIAQKYNLPVILHCVKAYNELLQVVKKFKELHYIIHGFNKKVEIAKPFLSYQVNFSFGAWLEKVNPFETNTISRLHSSKLFLETDEENDIEKVYLSASKLLNISMEDLKHTITQNYTRVFKL